MAIQNDLYKYASTLFRFLLQIYLFPLNEYFPHQLQNKLNFSIESHGAAIALIVYPLNNHLE